MKSRSTFQAPDRCSLATVAAALAAFVSFCILHRDGIVLDADGWAMWQAAISLVEGQGYRYFSGHPILSWPPLYAAYLAAWSFLLGPSGAALIVANAFLIVAQAALWMRTAWAIAVADAARPSALIYPLILFIGLVTSFNQQQVLAHNLVYVFLPLYVGVLWAWMNSPVANPPAGGIVWLAVWGTCLVLTHNACVVFVIAGATLLVLRSPWSWRSIAAILVISAVPVLSWLVVRVALGQSASHALGLGIGRQSAWGYAAELLFGIGRSFAPGRAGAPFAVGATLLFIGFVLARANKGMRFALAYTVLGALGTYGLFNLTWVSTPLSSVRPILFVPLVLVPVIYLVALPLLPRTACALMLLAVMPQFYWLTLDALNLSATSGMKWERLVAQPGLKDNWNDIVAGLPAHMVVPWDGYISRSYLRQPPVRTKQGLLIPPPEFEEIPGRRS